MQDVYINECSLCDTIHTMGSYWTESFLLCFVKQLLLYSPKKSSI